MKPKQVLIGISGSIAAYKVYDLIRMLQRDAVTVKCAITDAGRELSNVKTLEALLNDEVYHDLFGNHAVKKAIHIYLAEWADVLVVVPASADRIAKTVAGVCDDLLGATIIATRAPVLFVPAMHTNMWNNKIIQDKVTMLKAYGIQVVEPVSGVLADGRAGVGHIAPLETVVQRIHAALT